MKTKLIPFLLLVIVVTSCKKTKTVTNNVTITDTVTAVEMPVQSILKKAILFDTDLVVNAGNYEIGAKFYSSDSGVITKLGLRSPIVNKAFAVSLWDVATETLIVTDSITVTDSAQFAYASITPVHVSPNKAYIISYNNTVGGVALDYNVSQSKTTGGVQFPFADGDITFVSEDELSTSTSVYPTNEYTNSFLATVDVVFQAIK
jgi:hypothetical protein